MVGWIKRDPFQAAAVVFFFVVFFFFFPFPLPSSADHKPGELSKRQMQRKELFPRHLVFFFTLVALFFMS